MATQQEAAKTIRKKLDQVDELLKEAAIIADENSLEFYWEGPRQSLQYYGKGVTIPVDEVPYGYGWNESDEDGNHVVQEGTWMASSDKC